MEGKKVRKVFVVVLFLNYLIFGLGFSFISGAGDIYTATYSFEDDVGKTSTSIDFVDTDLSNAYGSITVISEYGEREDILDCFDNSAITYPHRQFDIFNLFGADIVSGTIELWVRTTDATKDGIRIYLYDGEVGLTQLGIHDTTQQWGYDDVDLGLVASNQWYHIRIDFDCTTDKVDIYIDGTKKINQEDFTYAVSNHVDRIRLLSIGDFVGHTYYDAIGYSWDTSYNVGDNLLPQSNGGNGGTPPTLDPLLTLIIVLAIVAIPLALVAIVLVKKSKKKKDEKVKIPGVTVPQQYVPTREVVQPVVQPTRPQEADTSVENILKEKLAFIEYLLLEEDTSKALDELGKFLEIAQKNNIPKYINWAKQKLNFFNKKLIKQTIMDLGTKFATLQVMDIAEKSKIHDEALVIETVLEMIENKEIYAEYFTGSKSIAFNLQANIDEIDGLMKAYEEWERDKVDKKE